MSWIELHISAADRPDNDPRQDAIDWATHELVGHEVDYIRTDPDDTEVYDADDYDEDNFIGTPGKHSWLRPHADDVIVVINAHVKPGDPLFDG